jgi:hypothetical protein
MEVFHSLGISLLYLVLLGIGLIYAVIILVAGAVHDLHIPGFDVHVGEHSFGPVDVHTVPDVHAGDVSHPSVKIPNLSPITIASFVTAFGAFGLISLGMGYRWWIDRGGYRSLCVWVFLDRPPRIFGSSPARSHWNCCRSYHPHPSR